MKYKKITENFLLISLDRLTRFKLTKDKYERVFSDIINRFCIFEAGESHNLKTEEKIRIVEEIINTSFCKYENDMFINKFLMEYEESAFKQDEVSKKYLKNKINYNSALEAIKNLENTPENVAQLIIKNKNRDLNSENIRKETKGKYPIEKIILCEGITEEILLPPLAKLQGVDFSALGIHVLQAGGKNQVGKKYINVSEEIKKEVIILLDSDAEEIKNAIMNKLQKKDKICLIKIGEFEDVLPKDLIIDVINETYKYQLKEEIDEKYFENGYVAAIKEIFREHALGDFKKSEFAKAVKKHLETTQKKYDFSKFKNNILNKIGL